MEMAKNHKELVVLTILLALAASMVNAAVFVYYPISITAQWGPTPIHFITGTNAGKDDLGTGNTIAVTLSDDETAASITVHPCRRGTTYYKDILRIVNNDTKIYYIGFRVNSSFTHNSISKAELIVRYAANGTVLGGVNLRKTGITWIPWPINPDTLSVNNQFRVDLKLEISSGSMGGDNALIELVYSPQSSESPP